MSKRCIARAHALSEAFLESPDRKVQQAAFDALQIIGSKTEDKRMERKIEEQSGRKSHKRKHGEGDAASTDGHRSSKRQIADNGRRGPSQLDVRGHVDILNGCVSSSKAEGSVAAFSTVGRRRRAAFWILAIAALVSAAPGKTASKDLLSSKATFPKLMAPPDPSTVQALSSLHTRARISTCPLSPTCTRLETKIIIIRFCIVRFPIQLALDSKMMEMDTEMEMEEVRSEERAMYGQGGGASEEGVMCSGGASDEGFDELSSVLLRHTKVIVIGNNRTKSVLVGLQGVVKKAVGLGDWHWLAHICP
ncbi:hypothetical protein GOP47_0012538 [Adiantum capillus-veneris]|uniref:Uncharacterized protein n=1 Tax=Adiantum capillus-veneris TaxID=13818 RepID=A0A9D4URY8_ADICA|nr:hypothetical protein GOP47_0012538 [Adiantum capillus-veneris]